MVIRLTAAQFGLLVLLGAGCSFDDPIASGECGSGGQVGGPDHDGPLTPGPRGDEATDGVGGSGGDFAECGDGFLDEDENCDDGNEVDFDGCDADCSITSVAVGVSAGGSHTCALSNHGEVRCWGDNTYGQLGYGLAVETVGIAETPYEFVGEVRVGERVSKISAGTDHTCALGNSGSVYCWGRNDVGQLGYGHTDDLGDDGGEFPETSGPVDLDGTAVDVAASVSSTCAVFEDGSVTCWGAGSAGELAQGGNFVGTIGAGVAPYERPRLAPVVSVGVPVDPGRIASGGGQHVCTSTRDAAVRCWGLNNFGQLGFADTDPRGVTQTPAEAGDVAQSNDVVRVAVGARHTCVVTLGSEVRCWGRGSRGALGYGSQDDLGDDEAPLESPVAFGGDATSVAVGDRFTCALTDAGEVRCWGASEFGQLGLGGVDSVGDDEMPVDFPGYTAVPLGVPVTAIEAGDGHVCALGADSYVRCWGHGGRGRLGSAAEMHIGDNPTDVIEPIPVFRPILD